MKGEEVTATQSVGGGVAEVYKADLLGLFRASVGGGRRRVFVFKPPFLFCDVRVRALPNSWQVSIQRT